MIPAPRNPRTRSDSTEEVAVSDMSTPPPEDEASTPADEASTPVETPPAAEVVEGAAAPVPAPPPAVPSRAGAWGPPGKIRSWGVVAILTIVTCGIYGLFWQYYVFQENKEHSGDGVGGAVGVILAIFVGIVNIFLLPAEEGNIYAKAGEEKPVSGLTGFWALIPIAGWFIWLYKVQTAINTRWEQTGAVRA